jgi:hypothetical protein
VQWAGGSGLGDRMAGVVLAFAVPEIGGSPQTVDPETVRRLPEGPRGHREPLAERLWITWPSLHNLGMTRTQERSSRPDRALIARAALAIGYGACSAAWAYADQKQIDLYSQGVYSFLHSTVISVGFLLLLPVFVGWMVGHFWVLAALIGPVATLGYLQATGYVSPWHDGSPPLGVPSLVILSLSGGLLLLGVVLRVGSSPRRVDPKDDWTWGK